MSRKYLVGDPCALRRADRDYENGPRWADVIDFLTMYPEARRQVARLLGEIDAR